MLFFDNYFTASLVLENLSSFPNTKEKNISLQIIFNIYTTPKVYDTFSLSLQSFMSDGTNSEAYCDETSWMEALRLASSEDQDDPDKATITRNPVYVDDEEDMIELDAWKNLPQMPSTSASNF